MTISIKDRTARFEVLDTIELRKLLEAVLADNAAMRADIITIDTAFDALVAKMNLDGGITDADYATTGTMTSITPTLVA